MKQDRGLSGAAFIVMSSVIVSRLTGFLREMLVPNLMDSVASDAYNMAFKITGLLYDLLVGGAIAAALIPVLTGYIARKREQEGWVVAGTFINAVMLTSALVCILGIIFAGPLVRVFAFGYRGQAAETETVALTRILFPSVVFIMLAGLVNGVLNSYHRFAAAAYGPAIYNIGSCISIYLFAGKNLAAVAWGVVASSALYFMIQLAFALKNMGFYRPVLALGHRGFRRLVRLAVPSLISSSIVQVNLLISAAFATLFPAGGVTALNMADKTWQMPFGVVAQGIGIAILPTLSARLAMGDTREYKVLLFKALRTVVVLTLPAAVGLAVLNREIVAAIFRFSEAFRPEYIPLAGTLLACFSLALVFQSVVTVMNRAFYAANDTRTPLVCGIITILVNGLLSLLFYLLFHTVAVIALSYSLSSILNCLLLLKRMDRKARGISLDRLIIFTIRTLAAAIIMGLVISSMDIIPPAAGKIRELLLLVMKAGIGAAVFFMAAYVLRMREMDLALRRILSMAGRGLDRLAARSRARRKGADGIS